MSSKDLNQLAMEMPEIKKAKLPDIDLILDNSVPKPISKLASDELRKSLSQERKKKSEVPERAWNRVRNYINDYELVSSKKRKFEGLEISVPDVITISRAYFKVWEIFEYFKKDKLVSLKSNFTYAGLAEGPGGMAQSVINYREKYSKFAKSDNYFAITLRQGSQESTRWGEKYPQLKKVKINYGDKKYGGDEDGDLLKTNNIIAFAKFVGEKVDLITADGAVFVDDSVRQMGVHREEIHYSLLFDEIVGALCLQKNGGSFIMKIYEIFTLPTAQLIYLLSIYYEKVWIFKPVTSRAGNSEKYVVCANFKGISKDELDILLKLSRDLWNDGARVPMAPGDIFVHSFFNNSVVPSKFFDVLKEYNSNYLEAQINAMIKGLTLARMYHRKRKEFNRRRKGMIIRLINNAKKWCRLNDIPIRKNIRI